MDFLDMRWREKRSFFRCPPDVFRPEGYYVAPIADPVAKNFVELHHYSGRYVAARCRFGLFHHGDLCGVAVFLPRYTAFPEQAAEALYLEHLSLALNPNMPLYAHGSLRDVLTGDASHDHSGAFALLASRLENAEWAVYRVHRIYHAKGRADRSLDKLATGPRSQMVARLKKLAKRHGHKVDVLASSPRFWTLRRRPDCYPTVEEMYVAAPADAAKKERDRFQGSWDRITLRA